MVPTAVRTASLIAGVSLLAMAVVAGVANFAVIEPLIAGDVAALAASAGVLRLGALGLVVVVALDVVVSVALYTVFRSDGAVLSAAAAAFRLTYSAVFLVAIAQLLIAVQPGADPAASVAAFSTTWDAALSLFGIHLLLIGVLAWRSSLIPRVVSVLVGIAGAGYLADSIAALGFDIQLGTAQFLFVGEVALLITLIVRGLGRSRSVAATPAAVSV